MSKSELIKTLRERTGAGIADCNKALQESNNDLEKSIDFLRTKGLASAAKKASNITAEGIVATKIDNLKASIIEVNSQTDFVAQNQKFQDLVSNILNVSISVDNLEELKNTKLADGSTVQNKIIENIASIGENLNLRRFKIIRVSSGIIASYIHNQVVENMGKIGVLVALESDLPSAKLADLGKRIAMHIAAAKPLSLDISSLDKDLITREKDVVREQSKSSGKPENVIEKMIEGRMRKFYEEAVLLEQIFVMDSATKISDLVLNTAKKLGGNIRIADFVKFELGEGVEKQSSNFADEVAAVAKR